MGSSHGRPLASHAYVRRAPETRVLRRSLATLPAQTFGISSDKPRFGFRRLQKVRTSPGATGSGFQRMSGKATVNERWTGSAVRIRSAPLDARLDLRPSGDVSR
jgi:hypothetical protein